MKLTKIFGLLFISLIAFVGTANAQDQTVTINTSHTYNVDAVAGVTYTWATNGGTSTDLTAQTGNSMTLIWDAAGTYDVTVFGTDANGCLTETRTSEILVVGAASVMFADAIDNQSIITCSLLTGDTPTATDFKVEFTGGVAPYTLVYDITDEAGTTTEQTINVAGTEQLLSLSDFENTTGSDIIVSIKLKSATTSDGATVTVNTGTGAVTGLPNDTRSVTVHGKPVISGAITLN